VYPVEAANIGIMNCQAKDVFGDCYVEPIDEDCIITLPYDAIHYTGDTAHLVIGQLAHALN